MGDDFDFNLLVNTPGWGCPYNDCINIMKGHVGLNEWGGELYTPSLDIAGSDHVDVYLSMKSEVENFPVFISFAGASYKLEAQGTEFEGEVMLPTNGLKAATIGLSNSSMIPVYIDRIQVTQPRKAGDKVYTWLEVRNVEAPETTTVFDALDRDAWYCYAYDVQAIKTLDGKTVKSDVNDRMLVNLKNGVSQSGIEDAVQEAVEIERYTLDGKKVSQPVKGVNIVRYSDGSVRKVLVK